MSQVMSLAFSIAFVALFRNAIKARPSAFYVLAAATACFGVYFTYHPVADGFVRAAAFAIQKGQVGFAFLAIVMFAGAFQDGSVVRKALQPIRGELSIIATILMIAHVVPYLASYAGMVGALGSLRPTVIASLGIAVVIIVLLAVLAVTSLQAVKRAMKANSWKRVQWLAYAFFALIFFHMLGYMMVPVAAGSSDASTALAFYGVVYASYAIARVRRAWVDKRGGHTWLTT